VRSGLAEIPRRRGDSALGSGKRAGETPALRKLLEEFCGVEEDCDGTIVHEVDGHVRLEDACLDANAERSKCGDKLLIERFAELRRSGENEARPAAASGVAVQSELRDGKDGAAGIEERTIHFALVVVEDAEIDDFLGHRNGGGGGIFASYRYEDHQSWADFAGDAAFYRNACAGDSLENDSHRSNRMILHCERRVLVSLFAQLN